MGERDGIHPHGYPVYAWEPWSKPSIVHLTLGQDRHEERVEALHSAAENMLLSRPGQPFQGAALWLHRRADAFAREDLRPREGA